MLPYIKEEILPRNRSVCLNSLLEIFMESLDRLHKKTWLVGKDEIMRLRVVSDIVVEVLSTQQKIEIDQAKADSFLSNLCDFILLIYNYKLDSDAEELLKLLSRLVYLEDTNKKVFQSARKSIHTAYETFAKIGAKHV